MGTESPECVLKPTFVVAAGAGFGDCVFYLPYIEDQRSEEPEQYRIIGFAGVRLTTYIIEYRQDDVGEYIWVVTAWHSTTQEQRDYEQETKI